MMGPGEARERRGVAGLRRRWRELGDSDREAGTMGPADVATGGAIGGALGVLGGPVTAAGVLGGLVWGAVVSRGRWRPRVEPVHVWLPASPGTRGVLVWSGAEAVLRGEGGRVVVAGEGSSFQVPMLGDLTLDGYPVRRSEPAERRTARTPGRDRRIGLPWAGPWTAASVERWMGWCFGHLEEDEGTWDWVGSPGTVMLAGRRLLFEPDAGGKRWEADVADLVLEPDADGDVVRVTCPAGGWLARLVVAPTERPAARPVRPACAPMLQALVARVAQAGALPRDPGAAGPDWRWVLRGRDVASPEPAVPSERCGPSPVAEGRWLGRADQLEAWEAMELPLRLRPGPFRWRGRRGLVRLQGCQLSFIPDSGGSGWAIDVRTVRISQLETGGVVVALDDGRSWSSRLVLSKDRLSRAEDYPDLFEDRLRGTAEDAVALMRWTAALGRPGLGVPEGPAPWEPVPPQG